MIQYIWIPLSCYWFTLKKIYFGCHWNKMFKGKVQICGDVLTMRIAYSSVNDIGIFSWNLVIDSTIVFFHLLNRLEWGGLFTSIRSVSLLIKTNCYDKCILERVVVWCHLSMIKKADCFSTYRVQLWHSSVFTSWQNWISQRKDCHWPVNLVWLINEMFPMQFLTRWGQTSKDNK